jgi:transcriptional regulator with XRE-family HTH domain
MNPDASDGVDLAFAERMNILIEMAGGPSEAARKSGLSRRVIDKYRNGESDPSRSRLVRLAAAADVDLQWLATGEGKMRPVPPVPAEGTSFAAPTIDGALMGRVLEGILMIYKEENARISPRDQGALASTLYGELVAAYTDPAERLIGLRLQLERLRRDLRAPPVTPGESKRSA